MISRAVKDIFEFIRKRESENSKYVVKISYLQIYNEIISDLLRPERRHLIIREDREKGIFVENLSEWVVHSPCEIFNLLRQGMSFRTTAPTKINDLSSRSHAVFVICLENVVSSEVEGRQVSTVRRAKLNLIGSFFNGRFGRKRASENNRSTREKTGRVEENQPKFECFGECDCFPDKENEG